ncbi:hypothetical protein [Streptomyces sp. NPDC056544]|uniref:hypothetical protein n=1 Tax=unclassified Streptomyces TaxID=2593676 RepID=UPI0036CAD2D3
MHFSSQPLWLILRLRGAPSFTNRIVFRQWAETVQGDGPRGYGEVGIAVRTFPGGAGQHVEADAIECSLSSGIVVLLERFPVRWADRFGWDLWF